MIDESTTVESFDDDFKQYGIFAQRLYPNDALCRFLGKKGLYQIDDKSQIRVLEVGCGSGGNLWMLAKEGFETYGMDASENSIKVAKKHLQQKYGLTAHFAVGRFWHLPYEDNFFDIVIDVVSLQHLKLKTSERALIEVHSRRSFCISASEPLRAGLPSGYAQPTLHNPC